MKKYLLILIIVFLVSLAASQSVEIQEEGVQVSQVENQHSILSFNVEGEFDSVEARITGVEQEGFNLRLAEDSTGLLNPPTNTENVSFTINEPGTYHLVSLDQTTLAYDQENRNCLRFYQVPDNYREVSECPEEAGTIPPPEKESIPETDLPVIPLTGAIIVLTLAAVLYLRQK